MTQDEQLTEILRRCHHAGGRGHAPVPVLRNDLGGWWTCSHAGRVGGGPGSVYAALSLLARLAGRAALKEAIKAIGYEGDCPVGDYLFGTGPNWEADDD